MAVMPRAVPWDMADSIKTGSRTVRRPQHAKTPKHAGFCECVLVLLPLRTRSVRDPLLESTLPLGRQGWARLVPTLRPAIGQCKSLPIARVAKWQTRQT